MFDQRWPIGAQSPVPFHVERAVTNRALGSLSWAHVGEVHTADADAAETIVNRITETAGVYRVTRADGRDSATAYVRVDSDGIARFAIR